MFLFISVEKTIECVLLALLLATLLVLCSLKVLGVLQSCGYQNKKLFAWVKKPANMLWERHGLLAFCCLLTNIVGALCFSYLGTYAALVGMIPFVAFLVLYVVADSRLALRTSAVATPRYQRLAITLFLLYAIVGYLLIALLNFVEVLWGAHLFSVVKYALLAVLPMTMLLFVCVANAFNKLFETPHNRKYIQKATNKVAEWNKTVIGITGSYGKTSTKMILSEILSQKYRVLSTPRSHNTPLGLANTINKNHLDDYDILIAEMGARNRGDITELCSMCPPTIALITGICEQHLASFGSLENVVKAKSEILGKERKTFVAADVAHYFAENENPVQAVNCVSDIVADREGTTFTLTLQGRSQRVHTKLLGKHTAENIALAAQVASELGMSLEEICAVIPTLSFVEHRLQKIDADNGITILDDGYNANVRGAKCALEVLQMFEGRKIVVTPGLVELGVLEQTENKALGSLLVGFDQVILVGDTLVSIVKSGYEEAGGSKELLTVVPTLSDAKEQLKNYLQAGDTVLFLNDLPDVY